MGLDLDRFLRHYAQDEGGKTSTAGAPRPDKRSLPTVPAAVYDLLALLGGRSFNGGIYKLHRLEDVPDWNTTIGTAWSETAGKICCFGYDWEGRQFTVYGSTVLQFSAGDLEFVEIPMDLQTFHNDVLVKPDLAEAALAMDFYRAWLASGGAVPEFGQCAGYIRPLFLGGVDWIENLEIIDLDVYWTVSAAVIAKARRVGVGGRIGRIVIED